MSSAKSTPKSASKSPDDSVLKVALVGPTNVGKSTLFNKLTGTRSAIVCDRPGVTVDRHEKLMRKSPLGPMLLIDTGGVGPSALEHPLGKEIEVAAAKAVGEADIIVFVIDGTRDVGIEEIEVASWLRHQKSIDKTPVVVVANKNDSKKFDASGAYALGFEYLVSVSAEHGEGIFDFWDCLGDVLAKKGEEWRTQIVLSDEENDKDDDPHFGKPRILVMGRPNAGKSTLLNHLLGTDRHVVSPVPGTTRDVIESSYYYKGTEWILCDTAGMRRPGRLERGVEWVAREKLKDAARKADAAILLLDAEEGVTDQDAAIAGLAIDFGLSLILCFNKWDQMRGDDIEDKMAKFERSTDLKLDFLQWVPKVKISALTGKGVPEMLRTVSSVLEARSSRVQTSKLNQLFEHKIRIHPHPLGPRGKVAKFYYLSQVSTRPPEFVLFSNIPGTGIHFSYKRFIQNCLRTAFGFEGTPIHLHFKQTK